MISRNKWGQVKQVRGGPISISCFNRLTTVQADTGSLRSEANIIGLPQRKSVEITGAHNFSGVKSSAPHLVFSTGGFLVARIGRRGLRSLGAGK
jgi:hypothetical protein